jgi:CheY-like chemotaxis protein
LGEHIELVLHVAHRATPVKGDPTQFERLLMNLALNARDAMPNGGKLIISTEVLAPEDINRSHPSNLPAAEYVLLTVSDTGLGMDATTLYRIFEPFFTTKERGQGTGLGLAAVYGIVTQSGGYIYASSELGRGSSFRIYLPLSHHDEVQEKTPSASLPSREAKELVLLVEDEPAVRDLARVFLEKLGYRVLCASDVHSAVAAMASSREKVELLLTDVIMPGCSGRELTQKIRTQCPDLKVLYMTGYTDDVLLQHQVHHSRAVVLRKPFTKDQLSACVRAVLEEGAQELVSS